MLPGRNFPASLHRSINDLERDDDNRVCFVLREVGLLVFWYRSRYQGASAVTLTQARLTLSVIAPQALPAPPRRSRTPNVALHAGRTTAQSVEGTWPYQYTPPLAVSRPERSHPAQVARPAPAQAARQASVQAAPPACVRAAHQALSRRARASSLQLPAQSRLLLPERAVTLPVRVWSALRVRRRVGAPRVCGLIIWYGIRGFQERSS